MGSARSVMKDRPRMGPIVVAGTATLATALMLPFSHYWIGRSPSFLPAVLAVVACFDAISVALLASDYVDKGDLRLLATCGAFVWSLILMGGYALSFPGVTDHAPLASTPSVRRGSTLGGTLDSRSFWELPGHHGLHGYRKRRLRFIAAPCWSS